MSWSTREQLKERLAQARKPALAREDQILCEKYPGQHVAFIDEWNGEELVRTVLVAAVEYGAFYDQVDQLPSARRVRLRCTRIPDPGVYELRPVWSE